MSGGVMEIAISAIIIESRYRRDMGDIAVLAKSIEELGLLHPVVLDMDHRLIAGQRRIEAFKALGRETIPARIIDMQDVVLGEHAENEMRKEFTPSERVAIGEEVERVLGNRQGQRTDLAQGEPVQKIVEVPKGRKTVEVAAKAAGFGNKETYRQAKAVAEKAAPAVVEAMDKGELSINAAAKVAKLPREQQASAIKGPRPFAHIRKLTDELAFAADKANVSSADADRLAKLSPGEQRELARDPRSIKGRLRALRMEERQAKADEAKQAARECKAQQTKEAFAIGKIVEALRAAHYDLETIQRIHDGIGGLMNRYFGSNLEGAIFEALDLPGEDDDEQTRKALAERRAAREAAQKTKIMMDDEAERRNLRDELEESRILGVPVYKDIGLQGIGHMDRLRAIDPNAVKRIADSIKAVGQLQPIIVTPNPGKGAGFELIAGLHRLKAMRKLKRASISCMIVDGKTALDLKEMAISENLDRIDLTEGERARYNEELAKIKQERKKNARREAAE